MQLEKNKKGIATITLIFVVFAAFFLVVFIIALSYGMGLADDSLSKLTGDIGNNSISQVYNNTLKDGVVSLETTVPQIAGIGILLGMVISMAIVGFNVKKLNKTWIALDVLILIVVEIIAGILVSSFTTYINSSSAFIAIARDTLPLPAKFILNLPIIIPIVGVIVMLATHFVSKEKEEEEIKTF